MSGYEKGPHGVHRQERIDFARLILVTEGEPRVLYRVDYDQRLLD